MATQQQLMLARQYEMIDRMQAALDLQRGIIDRVSTKITRLLRIVMENRNDNVEVFDVMYNILMESRDDPAAAVSEDERAKIEKIIQRATDEILAISTAGSLQ